MSENEHEYMKLQQEVKTYKEIYEILKKRLEEIEIVGEDISGVNFGFKVGDNLASHVGDMMWFGPLKFAQKLFFHTPLVYLFVFGSYFYHDKIWWPLKGRSLMEKLYRENKWGRLFTSYPE